MASEFIYAVNPTKLAGFFVKAAKAGVPEKVNLKTIESFGYKSKNDRRFLPILKGIGFIDQSGIPTPRWSLFRSSSTRRAAFASGIQEHYAKLFKLYPDAHQKDAEALHNFFSTHTKVGEATVKLIVATFQKLCALADFEQQPAQEGEPSITERIKGEPKGPPALSGNSPGSTSNPVTINLNIQLTLPENADSTTFDEFFKSMKTHLMDES